jgi:hypothetical protein
LVSSVDLSTNEKMAVFQVWKNEDGTKAGLEEVIRKNGTL